MKIGIIGAGSVATHVGRLAVAQGHEVVLSNASAGEKLERAVTEVGRGASGGSVDEAAACEVVLLAVPWKAVESVLATLSGWNGRILIDATNPFIETSPKLVLADLGDRSASEIVATRAPGARVVKAFNSIVMDNLAAGPRRGDARRVLFASGDDADAKAVVKDLITSFGFAAVDLGVLESGGRLQQAGGPLAGADYLVGD